MTIEEAIFILKETVSMDCEDTEVEPSECGRCTKCNDSLNMAIEALEKQIPKKPTLKHDICFIHRDFSDWSSDTFKTEGDYFKCPVCGCTVGELYVFKNVDRKPHKQRKKNFCEKCGQSIDWSESE